MKRISEIILAQATANFNNLWLSYLRYEITPEQYYNELREEFQESHEHAYAYASDSTISEEEFLKLLGFITNQYQKYYKSAFYKRRV